MKNTGCIGCHQLGQQSTRTIPPALGTFAIRREAWRRRVQSGQAGQHDARPAERTWASMSFANYGDWTDRIAKGELPFAKPPRPQGVERNIVVTLRDWMNEKQYLHDLIASDRRNPTVNAYGPLYGSPEYSSDLIPILDPVKNVATTFKAPVRDPQMPLSLGPGSCRGARRRCSRRPTGAASAIWDTRANNHNSMFDATGPAVAGGVGPRRREPGVLQGGLGSSVGEGVPDGARRPAPRGVRSEDAEVHVRRHLLLARTIRSSATTPTTRCGRAAAARWSAG